MSTETEPQAADAAAPHVIITLEEARALQDEAQLRELKRKILLWAGGWVTLLTAALAILSLFGVDALMKSVADKELAEIRSRVTQVAIDATADAKASAINATTAATTATDAIQKVTAEANELADFVRASAENATAAAAKATVATTRATEEANKLADLVKKIESQAKGIDTRLAGLREQIDDTNKRGIAIESLFDRDELARSIENNERILEDIKRNAKLLPPNVRELIDSALKNNDIGLALEIVAEERFKGDQVRSSLASPRWNLELVRAREALDKLPRRPGGGDEIDWGGVEIALLDTGYTRHSVFGAWQGENNDILLTARGLNLMEEGEPPRDPLDYKGFPGHGTRVGSVLSANLPGTYVGVAPGVPTVPYRAINSTVITSSASRRRLAAALRHAVEVSGCEVISMSVGTPLLSFFGARPFGEAVDLAYERGVIVIGAGGQVIDRVTYPGMFFRAIGVGGVKLDRHVWFEYDPGIVQYLDVWAPADDVPRANSVLRDGVVVDAEIARGDGTAYATVHVAAAAAMWLAFHGDAIDATYPEPWQRIEAFRKLLRETSQRVKGDYQPHPGTGILDIAALIEADLPPAGELTKEERLAAEQVL